MFVWFDLTPIKLEVKEMLEVKHVGFSYYPWTWKGKKRKGA